MNIAEAKQQVKDTVEAYLAKNAHGVYRIEAAKQRPLFLVGAPGIGKTAIMAQIAQELGVGLVSYSMTHHTRQSALGLPFIVHREFDGCEYDSSEYTMSEIVASVYDYMRDTGKTSGILFLDEINCVSETLYPSMLQFLQFKTFGRHRIPNDWVVVCAGNPPEFNKSVHEFDIVTLDRLRKIEVEPDYSAWKAYAQSRRVHPAVTPFLEVKPDQFYLVESTPRGKRFVTARGWDDLSELMLLFEDMGKPINKQLISQFLQDKEIADRFASYYELFSKYRSDYQIEAILAGKAPEEVAQRAQAAAFDERLALLSLLLDGICSHLNPVLTEEQAVAIIRDTLRAIRPEVEGGATANEVLSRVIVSHQEEAESKEASGLASVAEMELNARINEMLQGLRSECLSTAASSGVEAFSAIHYAYRALVAGLESSVQDAGATLNCAFDFLEKAFGNDREMLVFVTELTARSTTAQFINRFGNERYFANNSQLLVDDRRKGFLDRISQLAQEEPAKTEGQPVDLAVLSNGTEMAEYYANAQFEFGFASLCNMNLPLEKMRGSRVLDIGCRRGKGVFKMSSLVGANGHVVGVDWSPSFITQAEARKTDAWRKSGLPQCNMEFHAAFPEDLMQAGIGDQTLDLVFINSVLSLTYSPQETLNEISRVLKDDGMLVLEAVVADQPRNEEVVRQARALGNSIQAAPAESQLEEMLRSAGLSVWTEAASMAVDASLGFKFNYEVPVVETSENVQFTAKVFEVHKDGWSGQAAAITATGGSIPANEWNIAQ